MREGPFCSNEHCPWHKLKVPDWSMFAKWSKTGPLPASLDESVPLEPVPFETRRVERRKWTIATVPRAEAHRLVTCGDRVPLRSIYLCEVCDAAARMVQHA